MGHSLPAFISYANAQATALEHCVILTQNHAFDITGNGVVMLCLHNYLDVATLALKIVT